MSMYGVNCGVPKTLVRHLVENFATQADARTASVLRSVLGTPVSPELLPPDESGQIAQKTEEKIGPYELHDFFLYHFSALAPIHRSSYFLPSAPLAANIPGSSSPLGCGCS